MMTRPLQYLLLQIRNPDDPMRRQEQHAFAATLDCSVDDIRDWDLLSGGPDQATLDRSDIVLIGGSGDYSAAGEGEWLERALDALRDLYDSRKPTFASCWGFQALARALGGTTIHDLEYAELGTLPATLTEAGKKDPVFGPLGCEFMTLQGHQDRVIELPPGAVLLASTELVPLQAFTFADRALYATQFHPELSRQHFLERMTAYPKYIRKITGLSFQAFADQVRETPEVKKLLTRFVTRVRESCS